LGKTELFVPGQDGKFASILEWSKVNFLMMHGRVGTHVLLQSRTEAGHQDTSTIDVSSAGHGLVHVQQQLRTGATLVIDKLDEVEPDVSRCCRDLERLLQVPVKATAFASTVAGAGGRHPLARDTVIAQVSGMQHLKVFDIATRNSVGSGDDATVPARWTGVVDAGDAIYIPRGWIYESSAPDGASLHIAFHFASPSGLDLATRVINLLRDSEFMQMDVPRFAPPEVQAVYLAQFQHEMREALFSPGLLLGVLNDVHATADVLPFAGLPWTGFENADISDDCTITALIRFDSVVEHLIDEDALEVCCGAKRFKFPSSAERLISYLLEGATRSVKGTIDRFGAEFPVDAIRGFLSDCVKHGLIGVHYPQGKQHGRRPACG
jgi:hypothetical protein